MIDALFKKTAAAGRAFLPVATVIGAVLLGAIPLPFPDIASVAPFFGLATVYYWAIYRPDLLRPSAVFCFGLLNDVVQFFPFGLSAFVFLGVYQTAFLSRRFFVKQIFFMLWSGFAFLGLIAFALYWGVIAFASKEVPAFAPMALQFAMTLAIFPLLAWFLIWAQKRFLSQGG